VQAESGLCSITGHPAGPGRVGVSACDIACGMAAHAGVLEALIERGATGRGKGLKVSLFDGMADWMNAPLLIYEGTGKPPARMGLAHPSICPYGAFATADGSLVLISIQNEREWGEFCARFLNEPDLPKRAGFETNVIRVAHRETVDGHIAAAFARLTRDAAAALAGPDFDAHPRQRVIEVTEEVTIASDKFEFVDEFRGLEILTPKGTLIGRDAGREVRTPYDDCVLIMPSRRLTRGQTAVRLGRFVA